MSEVRGVQVFVKGEVAIVCFRDKGFLSSQTFLGDSLDHLDQAIDTHHVHVLIFDLARITALPSTLLGIMVGLRNRGIEIRLFNVGPDVQFVLETANLDQLFDVRKGDLTALIEEAVEV